ncbi:hypothetical protein RZS08_03690, partial [Arthrospira platensis SPKY1]|nr:hypothetical protein [Arthrospira platensis SPKY1]
GHRRLRPPGTVTEQQLGIGAAPSQFLGHQSTQAPPESVENAPNTIDGHRRRPRRHQDAPTHQGRAAQGTAHGHTQQFGVRQVVLAIGVPGRHEAHTQPMQLAGVAL